MMVIGKIIPVATGEEWIGYGVRSFRSIINDLISNAENELVLTAYILTDKNIVDNLKEALERGIKVEVYLYEEDVCEKNNAVIYILQLRDKYDYLKIYRIKDKMLHAKVLVADGKKVLSGSANFTFSGMISNYELGFLVEDPSIAIQILKLIKKLGKK